MCDVLVVPGAKRRARRPPCSSPRPGPWYTKKYFLVDKTRHTLATCGDRWPHETPGRTCMQIIELAHRHASGLVLIPKVAISSRQVRSCLFQGRLRLSAKDPIARRDDRRRREQPSRRGGGGAPISPKVGVLKRLDTAQVRRAGPSGHGGASVIMVAAHTAHRSEHRSDPRNPRPSTSGGNASNTRPPRPRAAARRATTRRGRKFFVGRELGWHPRRSVVAARTGPW